MSIEQKKLVSSGKVYVDEWLNGGYTSPSTTIIASRRGAGKTKWLLESALSNAQNGINSLFVGLDNTIEANIDFLVYIFGIEQMKKNATTKFHLAELENGSLKMLDSLIEENVLLNDVEIVYIDSIEPIIASYGDTLSSWTAYNKALEAISMLSKRHDVPIVIERTLTLENDIGEPSNLTLTDVAIENSLDNVDFVVSLFREKNITEHAKRKVSIRLLKSSLGNQLLEHNELFVFEGELLSEKPNLD